MEFLTGPVVGDVLTQQYDHRSNNVWDGVDYVRMYLYERIILFKLEFNVKQYSKMHIHDYVM